VIAANLGDKGSSAVVAVGNACKHIVQIVELLDERKLSFSFCLNRNEVLVQAGFGLLLENLNLARDGQLIKDSNRLICTVMDMLESGNCAGLDEFRRLGCSIVAVPSLVQMSAPHLPRHTSNGHTYAPSDTLRATQKSLKAIGARFSSIALKTRQEPQEPRRATLPAISPNVSIYTNPSSTSLSSIYSEPPFSHSESSSCPAPHRASFSTTSQRQPTTSPALHPHRNIDFLSFTNEPLGSYSLQRTHGNKSEIFTADWEGLLSSPDNGQANIHDTIYGHMRADALLDVNKISFKKDPNTWAWSSEQAPPPKSVLSFTDESLTSGEDFSSAACDYGSTPGSDRLYSGIMIPSNFDVATAAGLTTLDGNFGL